MIIANHEYHIVELNGRRMPDEVLEWLHKNYGLGSGKRWFYRHPKIYFFNSKDHMMFILRWS